MSDQIGKQTIFLAVVRSSTEKVAAHLLIESIRSFGGEMSQSPIWLFEVDHENVPCEDLTSVDVRVVPLDVPEGLRRYFFGSKVFACAYAEELAEKETRSLVCMDPLCAIVDPPRLYALDANCDAAVRPVHIQNVGLSPAEPLDVFWKGIYARVGVSDVAMTVDSFVDAKQLRAYFNSHGFSVNPAKGLMHRWLEHFEELVKDRDFQATACLDERHQIFLFQALLSALLVSSLGSKRIRILPTEYNYPYNLQASVPSGRRARVLNDLVSFTYEDRLLDPATMDDIEVREPLRSWLSQRVKSGRV